MIKKGSKTCRYVPSDYFENAHRNVNSTFEKMRNYKNLNSAVRY